MWVNAQSSNRRWVVLGSCSVGLCAALMIAIYVVYPRVGEYKLAQAVTKLGKRFGRTIALGHVEVGFGRAEIRDLIVTGPADAGRPMARIDRVLVRFRGWRSMIGEVSIDLVEAAGVTVNLRRNAAGIDNVSDLLATVRGVGGNDGGLSGPGRDNRYRPKVARVRELRVSLEDAVLGVSASIGDGSGDWSGGDLIGSARNVVAIVATGQRVSFGSIGIKKGRATRALIDLHAGEVVLWPKLALSGIDGTVIPEPASGSYRLSIDGGYGGVASKLWKAVGAIDVLQQTASIDLTADKFSLDRLQPILKDSYLVDYSKTSMDATLRLEINRASASFAGAVHVRDLNVGHPMLADREVRHLDVEGAVQGTVQRDQRIATLSKGNFVARGLPFSITGDVAMSGGREASGEVRAARRFSGRLVIPPIACQSVLDSIPTEMVPYMRGYQLSGTFGTDVQVKIDYANLDETVLDGSVGIRNCKVKRQPTASPKRLIEPFEHYVEVELDQWISFLVGPENPDFVPYDQISPHLINSIMTTEDSGFMKHRGFIVSEFRSALIKNLKAGYFRYGASSITMQLAKNVLLYREKTLSRKLQELFFTWDIENTLEKERILEIYFNVIEYGPGLYGIGPAAMHFFGKLPKDLGPVEAAFFSSILPAPKPRYRQYCEGTLTQWTSDKIERILGLMVKRGRLTEEEYSTALLTPLRFIRDDNDSEKDCLDRWKRAIRKSRPTNPLKQ
jgi:Transglycosylase